MTERDEPVVGEWIGCACPHCRAVFRVAGEMRGRQVTCPSCRKVSGIPLVAGTAEPGMPTAPPPEPPAVELPHPAEEEKADGGAARDEGDELEGHEHEDEEQCEEGHEGQPESRGEETYRRTEERSERVTTETLPDGRVRVRKRSRKKKAAAPVEGETLGWDLEDHPRKETGSPDQGLIWIGLAVVAVALGTFGLITTLQDSQQREREEAEEGSGRRESREVVRADIPDVPDTTALLELLRPEAERFFAATTVEELLQTVRKSARSEARIRRYYQAREFRPEAVHEVAPNGVVTIQGRLFAVLVVMSDFSKRELVVERLGDRFLVDWESWVGYSELSWEEFLAKRPREPILFRVLSRQTPYYSEAFPEEEWLSFRFRVHVFGEREAEDFFFAYARDGSEIASELQPPGRRNKDAAFVVRIRFPDDAPGEGEGGGKIPQVLIEEVVAEGWVVDFPGSTEEEASEVRR